MGGTAPVGLVPEANLPLGRLVMIVATAVAVVPAAAAVPARAAARITPADLLLDRG